MIEEIIHELRSITREKLWEFSREWRFQLEIRNRIDLDDASATGLYICMAPCLNFLNKLVFESNMIQKIVWNYILNLEIKKREGNLSIVNQIAYKIIKL